MVSEPALNALDSLLALLVDTLFLLEQSFTALVSPSRIFKPLILSPPQNSFTPHSAGV
jgi:hypothetical protein